MKKEIPILFSTPMVQAILEGRKTMTRRIVKRIALDWLQPEMFTPEYVASPDNSLCPYGKPGDILWVRESWAALRLGYDWETGYCDDVTPEKNINQVIEYVQKEKGVLSPRWVFAYKANGNWEDHIEDRGFPWRPSIHMPKAACRIYLEVINVRIERLHEISWQDAVAESCTGYRPTQYEPTDEFKDLWQRINGIESWESNPWVWVVSFKVLSTTGRPIELLEPERSVANAV